MRRETSARHHGLIGQIVLVLLLIVVLIILILPELINPPHPAWNVKQRAQLHSISTALELHANEFGGYPPSDANDPAGVPYCGAMKLAEAALGQDLLGVHCETAFRADGLNATGTVDLYLDLAGLSKFDREANLNARRGPYLQPKNANAYRLVDIYGEGNTGPFDGNSLVLCDTYLNRRSGGKKTGMPILYYRADPKGTAHDVNDPGNAANIYDYRDNQMLLALGVPGEPKDAHPLADPKRFYMNTASDSLPMWSKPYNAEKFILISAGYDGLYGTADDICNFDWKYRK